MPPTPPRRLSSPLALLGLLCALSATNTPSAFAADEGEIDFSIEAPPPPPPKKTSGSKKGAKQNTPAPQPSEGAWPLSQTPQGPQEPTHSVDFSLGLSQFDYLEQFDPPGKSSEKGLLFSIYVSYRRQNTPQSPYLLASAEFSPSGTRFDGTTQAPKYTPVQQNTSGRFFRLEQIFGYVFRCPQAGALCVSAYSGLGGRLWVRGDTTRINGIATPAELYYWLYLPVGGRIEKDLPAGFSAYLDASVRWMFLGGITVKFSELASEIDDAHGNLGGKIGARLELGLRKQIFPNLSAQLAPWFEYSAIGKGDEFKITSDNLIIGTAHEPASRTYQYGARVGITMNY